MRITVHVTSFETGRHIPNASVEITEEGSDVVRSSRADARGVVTYPALKAARYHVRAGAAGYRPMSFGEEPGLGGTLLAVNAGRAPIELEIALHRGSTIAGVVTNDLNEPVVGADVRAINRHSPVDSRLLVAANAKTDDRGAYRLIGLEAGQYFVSATDGLSVAFANGTGTPATPRLITVGVDAQRSDVNIKTRPSPTGTIAGSIAGPGAGAPGMSVMLMQDAAGAGFVGVTSARIEPGARFTIADVPAGKYVLIARPGTVRAWARTAVSVTANGQATPTVALHPGGRISGTVVAPSGVRGTVGVSPLGADHPEAASANSGPVSAGSFAIPNVAPGRYRWLPSPEMPPMWGADYTPSVFLKDQDVTDLPFEVGPDAAIENVRIELTRTARVSGTVRDASGKPTSRGAVIVASTSPRDWTEVSRRIRLARADTAGFYEIGGLPAGSYTVSTVTALSAGQLGDPAFLKTLAKSRQVTLTQGESATVDLRLK
ncbi:MAG TPA: carboxypeptidase-like regulatory domain-containing protein [Vicinamibacterales bacterium]|nr:carboxypeptidase-like regulatory domain-containing protein [Vicinamibacterales bacterium]